MSAKSLMVLLVPMLLMVASAQAVVTQQMPVAIPYFSGEQGDPATNAIDGNYATHCVINTDSLDGTDPATVPAYASGTTGHMIFDMGEIMDLTDFTMFSRNHSLQLGVKDFDLFYFADGVAYDSDDIEGDSNIVLIDNYTSTGPTLGDSETFSWASPISTQYIGMRVNSAYPQDTPYNGITYCNFQIAEVRLGAEAPMEAGPVSPVDVPLVSGTIEEGHDIMHMIDGDPGTMVVVYDDTLTGVYPDTEPAFGSEPVTGHLVFDMGEAAPLIGAILTSRNHELALCPEDVDFFYYADDDPFNNAVADDIEGDADIISITNHVFSDTTTLGATEQVDWDSITARYIGMRINSSYESGPTYYNFQIADMQFIVEDTTPDQIPGDANKDGKVDGSDVTILAGNWQKGVSDGQTAKWEEGDFNGDGKVDGSDVTILAGNWQAGVEAASAAVPEPSTIVLLLSALTALVIGRRVRK